MSVASTLATTYQQTWGRAFASMYAAMITKAERGPLGAQRATLLGDLSGDIVEIGAGTGVNLVHYPEHLTSITMCEPEPAMFSRLEHHVRASNRSVVLKRAPAEALPLDSASADVVVSTLVLCTVRDLDAALDEIARILRPGGSLVLLEHVRSSKASTAKIQDALRVPWSVVGYGCQCNRDTVRALDTHGFATASLEPFSLVAMTPLISEAVSGVAHAPR